MNMMNNVARDYDTNRPFWERPIFWLALFAALLVSQSFFILNQTQQALVVQLGNPRPAITTPGLHYKIPFIQNIVVYDKRVLNVAPPSESVLLADQKRLEVDAYARYRIVDALAYFQRLGSAAQANERLAAALQSTLRSEMAKVSQVDILSAKRDDVMEAIRQAMNTQVREFGVEVIDVRIRSADLPREVQDSVFRLMESQRRQEAALIRAQGAETAAQIMADADKERTIILSNAEREAQIMRGQGDQEAIKIFADAFGKDPEFFAFYRSMQAYRTALGQSDTTLLLSPSGEFFKYFKNGSVGK